MGSMLRWGIDGPGKRRLWGQGLDPLTVQGIRAKDAEGLNEESIHGAREGGLGSSETQPQLWLTLLRGLLLPCRGACSGSLVSSFRHLS